MERVREAYVRLGRQSVTSLMQVMEYLSEAELYAILDLEQDSTRRKSIIRRVAGRLVHLNEMKFRKQLQESYPCLATIPRSTKDVNPPKTP